MQTIVSIAPASSRPRIREIIGSAVDALTAAAANPPQWIQPLDFSSDPERSFTLHSIFWEPTASMRMLDCHLSILEASTTPHAPHQHIEEELIVPLSGEVNIITEKGFGLGQQTQERIAPGQLVYHAANQPHTIRSMGPGPASYLVFKWRGEKASKPGKLLPTSIFNFSQAHATQAASQYDFATKLIFEAPTLYLKKLHCHVSTMRPGASYEPHGDPYEVAIILLNGTVETLDKQVTPQSVIFYPADRPHGMKNVGQEPARYIVFEFHGHAQL